MNTIIYYDSRKSASDDAFTEAFDYKPIAKRIIHHVEGNRFLLLERLTQDILNIIMEAPQVLKASVEVDKPHARAFPTQCPLTQTAEREISPYPNKLDTLEN